MVSPCINNCIYVATQKWYGWKTVSWIYPSTVKVATYKYVKEWFKWDEREVGVKNENEREIGKRLMTGIEILKTKDIDLR